MALKKIKKGEIVVLVIPNTSYMSGIMKVTKQICTSNKTTVYVSLNKLYKPLTSKFESAKIDLNKFLFIDGISKSAGQEAPDAKNCLFVHSAGALTELSLNITKAINTGKFDSLVFDSLSTLLIYNKKEVVIKFVQSLVNKLRNKKITTVFAALKGDTEKGLLKEIGMFVDEVVEY